ncbi:MAG: DEAD/DEAH box helicase family protein [Desulfohalobiaceae bacterium]|nr:DEAD/DEAH box helicase family protein [Desulfohalobiaceae bacterium]
MEKQSLSERDICTKFVTPSLERAGWDIQTQVREEVTLTHGRIIVRGTMHKRGRKKRADYILSYKRNIPIAVIEVKDNTYSVGSGMQQALQYAEMIDVPFVFSTNGSAFLEHDRTGSAGVVEQEIGLDRFPSPETLWNRYCIWKGLDQESRAVVEQDYFVDSSGKIPRYYQLQAINRSVEAIATGRERILLVMATGTGKTYTAFQIIWRLWKSGTKKRILFLADRNILVDQTKTNDFKPFGPAMTKIKNRQADKSFEIYLALYQAVSGTEEERDIYKQFSPDFFDLVVVDECHRGSAAEDAAWHDILTYYQSAAQIGMTATPKETSRVSNIHYFGEPLFTYSLKQGIADGFLAPYKVVRLDLDKDLMGYRPEKGKRDKLGQEIEDRIYNQKDFDRAMVLEQRTELVARKITEFLKATGRYDKTIVFCEDIDHAERMRRALVNQNQDLAGRQSRYVMRITGDNPEGKAELDNFVDPESTYPVVTTTSRLMSTGVDAQTCKLIVLDRVINSMTEFKQIIGRGTRIREDYGKYYFTIMDFKKATELFADPDFDGEPVQIYTPAPEEPPNPPDEVDPPEEPPGGGPGEGDPPLPPDGRVRYVIDDVQVYVLAERVQYYGREGQLITESLKDYTKRAVQKEYESLDAFLKTWTETEKKQAIIKELEEQGVFLEALAEEVGKEYGPFDLICHVAFDRPPLTRRERAENVRKRDVFTRYGAQARSVLEALLQKYQDEGLTNLDDPRILQLAPFDAMGTPVQLLKQFGGRQAFETAVHELQDALYDEVA